MSEHKAKTQDFEVLNAAKKPTISVVVPVYNERATLRALHEKVVEQLTCIGELGEILYIDDGSTDGSPDLIRELCAEYSNTRLVAFAINYGKAAAIDAGFHASIGEIIITMDSDLQDDPAEIPRFVKKIREGFDLVAGWKSVRHDPWHKTVPSKLFNLVVSTVSGLDLHDFNCGYKAYTRKTVQNLSIYGELHRYIPVIVHNNGGRIAEISVHHHPRMHGQSKYGWERLPKGFFDLITIMVTTRYLKRPLHFFGSIGLGSFLIGASMLVYLAILWMLGKGPIGNRPLLIYGVLISILGVQIFSIGVLAEIMVFFAQRSQKPLIREIAGGEMEVDHEVHDERENSR